MSTVDPNSIKPDPSVPDDRPSRTADEQEVVYYEGRPMLRANEGKVMGMFLLAAIFVALPVVALIMDWPWFHWTLVLICLAAAALVILIPMILMRTTRYRITSYRIDFERGLLKKQIDTLELWHVEDLHFEQGIFDRMMGVGSIIIVSHDDTTPKLELHGIPNPRQVFDALKNRVIAVKRQRGVIKVDSGM